MGLWLGKITFVMHLAWLLVVSVGSIGKITGRATCENTELGQPARVTCHYRANVVEASVVSAVSLLHATDGKQEKVMECHHFPNNGFDCIPKAGYTLNGNISDQMIINIPTARPEHQGTYYCEIGIQETEFQMESCVLQYKEPNDAATSTPPSEQDSDDHLKGDTGTSNASALMIAVLVLFLVQLVFVILLFVRWRHRCRRNPKARQQDTDVYKSVRLLPDSNTDDLNGRSQMNFIQFPYNLTDDKHLLLDLSIKEGMLRLVAHQEPEVSIENGTLHRVAYHGSNTPLSLDSETSCTDTAPPDSNNGHCLLETGKAAATVIT